MAYGAARGQPTFDVVQTFSNSSMRRTILDGGTLRMAAILTTTRMLGLLMPRSIRLMYVRSNPLSRANRSCEISLLSRISRSASPNAFSEPVWG